MRSILRGAEYSDVYRIAAIRAKHYRVSDERAKALHERWGDQGMIEFAGVIGYYSMLCMMANAVELEAGPSAEVLAV